MTNLANTLLAPLKFFASAANWPANSANSNYYEPPVVLNTRPYKSTSCESIAAAEQAERLEEEFALQLLQASEDEGGNPIPLDEFLRGLGL